MRARVATLTPQTWTSAIGRRRFAVVKVQAGTRTLDVRLTEALSACRPEGVTFGIVDVARRHPPQFWLDAFRSSVGPLNRDGKAVDGGYYVFRDGYVVAHHPGGGAHRTDLTGVIRYLSTKLVDGPATQGESGWVYEGQPGSGGYDPRGGRKGPGQSGRRRTSTSGSRQRTEAPPPPPPPPPSEAARDPYSVLGVASDCSDAELRTAYKSALKMNHPDRVAHLSPALQAFALAETQHIRAAWEALKALRGL